MEINYSEFGLMETPKYKFVQFSDGRLYIIDPTNIDYFDIENSIERDNSKIAVSVSGIIIKEKDIVVEYLVNGLLIQQKVIEEYINNINGEKSIDFASAFQLYFIVEDVMKTYNINEYTACKILRRYNIIM